MAELIEVEKIEEQPAPVEHSALFQAVGIITGEVDINPEGKSTIRIGNIEYPLYYAKHRKKAFAALQKEIEVTSNHTQRLIVYPKALHFPKKEQPHQIAFQVVGFDAGRADGECTSKELGDLEFKLCGLWQFIPVCSTPCISVFKNLTRERIDYVKQAEPAQKVRFMKASHIPLLWKDSIVKPFRFNPKLEKEQQGHTYFVEVKAKFLPHRNAFGFDSLLALPKEDPPQFLKAGKKDKATVLQEAMKRKREEAKQRKTEEAKPKPRFEPPKKKGEVKG